MVSVAAAGLRTRVLRSSTLGAVRAQVGVAGAQWTAGVGNLVFAVVAARVLTPAAFADLGVFLGAYVLLHLPAAGVGAGAALAPDVGSRRRRLTAIGVVVGATIAATAPLSAPIFSVPVPLVLALAAAAPSAALLGLERGTLFAADDRRRIAGSLLVEPAVRVAVGLAAASAIGPVGGAIAVTAAGYAALAVATTAPATAPATAAGRLVRRPGGRSAPRSVLARSGTTDGIAEGQAATTSAGAATITFLLFAVLQQQDLLVAKARLADDAAGSFAVLSTIGGAVAFASATIPLAILPRARRSSEGDRVALALTVAIGLGATAAGLAAGDELVEMLFGEAYLTISPLLAPYLAAMGLLGVGRVLAARRCSLGDGSVVAGVTVLAVAVHLVGLAAFGTTISGVVIATFGATAVGAGGLALDLPRIRDLRARAITAVRGWARTGDLVVVAALTAAAGAVRVVSTRGLWVDEAITVAQARLPFDQMLEQLRSTDVHPPLHHAIVWLLVQTVGTGEAIVRAPSMIAGALLVPVVFGLGSSLYGRRTGLIAAAFISVAPFAVWYSQEARMYALFMLFATMAVWAQVAILKGDRDTGGGRWAWAAYVLSTAAMAWTQWFAVVPIAAQQLVFAGALVQRRHDRTRRRRFLLVWAAALGASLLLVLPLVGVFVDQFGAYAGRRTTSTTAAPAQAGAAASGLAGDISVYAVGANALWALVGYHSDRVMTQLAALWPLLLLVGLGALGRGRSNRTTTVLTLIALPAVAFVLAGVFKRDLFELRYFAGAVPLLLVLAARTVTVVFRHRRAQALAAVLASLLLVVGLVDQQLNGANPRRYDFEGALGRISAEADPDDVILFEPDYLAEVVDYYAPDMPARSIDARATVDEESTVWVLATTRVADEEATSARVGKALADLEQSGRTVESEIEVPNVRAWELSP